MESHLSPMRLLAIAEQDDSIFTTEEFKHLKACPECFDDWSLLIHGAIRSSVEPARLLQPGMY